MRGLSLEEVERLYVKYGESVLYRCRQLLRNEDAGWDAMHQTFVRAIRYRASFRRDAQPQSWLFSIATRVCVDEINRQGRQPLDLESGVEITDALLTDPPRTMEDRLMQTRTVARLLSAFSEKVQQIVVLRYFDELEVKEIALQMGVSERTVARRLQQFIDRARRMLSEVAA
ncbi:MAG: sigma-70 family RNA polymerase sigma factor [Myxococcota bacterium]